MAPLMFILVVVFLTVPAVVVEAFAPSQRGRKHQKSSLLLRSTVLCIGHALVDCMASDDACGFGVEEMVAKNAWKMFHGGAPANVATGLRKLGTTSAFAGCMGADEDGDAIEGMLRQEGVDTTLLHRCSDGSPTRRVMVTRTPDGEHSFAGFWGSRPVDAFADCVLDGDGLLCCEEADAVIASAKWLYCGTLSLAFDQSADAIYRLVARGREGGARLIVDVNWRPIYWPDERKARADILRFVQCADVVKLTDEEAEWLVGVPAAEALADPMQLQKHFPNAIGLLVTAGEKGASYSMLGHVGRVETFQVEVKETTGAGDAFTAGFLHALLSMDVGLNKLLDSTGPRNEDTGTVIEGLVRFATAVASLTCTAEGPIAAQPTFSEVESFLIHGQKV